MLTFLRYESKDLPMSHDGVVTVRKQVEFLHEKVLKGKEGSVTLEEIRPELNRYQMEGRVIKRAVQVIEHLVVACNTLYKELEEKDPFKYDYLIFPQAGIRVIADFYKTPVVRLP